MNLTTIPDAWYIEALPDGSFAALAFSGLELVTHLGTLPTPAGRGPLYVRITNVGGFRAIGQAQDTDSTQEYIDGIGWLTTTPGPFGVSGAIYDLHGVPHIATPQSGIGVNGWRYVTPENVLITGDATYFNPALQINEFTQLPNGFLVGQNNGSDLIALVVITNDGIKRLVYDGAAMMPRVNADAAGNVAIAFYLPSPGSATAVMLQTTYAELQACPAVTTAAPEPLPEPEPEPMQPIPPQPRPDVPQKPVPVSPPQESPMSDPFVKCKFPTLINSTGAATPLVGRSPFALRMNPDDWGAFNALMGVWSAGSTTDPYLRTAQQTYEALCGGFSFDTAAINAVVDMYSAAVKKNLATAQQGRTDMYRCIKERINADGTPNVDAVIAAQGQ